MGPGVGITSAWVLIVPTPSAATSAINGFFVAFWIWRTSGMKMTNAASWNTGMPVSHPEVLTASVAFLFPTARSMPWARALMARDSARM